MSHIDYYVEIVRDSDEHVESRMGPMSFRRAEKVADGAGINLNWDEYTVRIIEEPSEQRSK